MGVTTLTSWFLTSEGWRSTDDRVAVWDAEVWPTGTLMVGWLEEDSELGCEIWTEYWRSQWQSQELQYATARFGTAPPSRVCTAA